MTIAPHKISVTIRIALSSKDPHEITCDAPDPAPEVGVERGCHPS